MQRVSSKTDVDAELAILGSAIRGIRKEKNISQEALADWAGLDRSHMGRIERGERNVTVLNLLRIAKALDCKLAELFQAAGL
ncbi:helix-turn-helix transcriptional regulator [Paraburkholderia sp. J41]|uniref:helix-turn-helix domain-containing protein n=1 Tax=Paraburkholderia sp. J41 TaxID=2805433 RepID=UPI002AC32F14|nr:helix-turn-helix transcriptional regulator [Paraburkholderia sp. J41]